jgi:hypothetical protein
MCSGEGLDLKERKLEQGGELYNEELSTKCVYHNQIQEYVRIEASKTYGRDG